jgi:hypothetical protein
MYESFRNASSYKADGPEDQIVDSQRREIMTVDRTGTVHYGIMLSEVSDGRDSLRLCRSSCRTDRFSKLTPPHHKHKISYKMPGLTLSKIL